MLGAGRSDHEIVLAPAQGGRVTAGAVTDTLNYDARRSELPKASFTPEASDRDPQETREWIESLEAVVENGGRERAQYLLKRVLENARRHRILPPGPLSTDYVNTISTD